MAFDYVRIHNAGEEPFVGKYDGSSLTIPPGEERIVPYNAMRVWMGDPELRDSDTHKERSLAFNRICMKYHARGLMGNNPELLPVLEAYDPDGNRIITIMDDPTGESITPDPEAPTDAGSLQRQIDRLQQQLQSALVGLTDSPNRSRETEAEGPTLGGRTGQPGVRAAAKERAAAIERGELDPDDDLDVPSDAPSKPKVGPAGGRSPRKAPAKRPARKG